MGSENLHEDPNVLSNEIKNRHRAIVSLMEELEAVDWYGQRAEACTDDELREVLVHNMNEEIEHAMMTLEWIRRREPKFAENIRTYIGSKGPITEVEEAAKEGGGDEDEGGSSKKKSGGSSRSRSSESSHTSSRSGSSRSSGSLGIGSLKGK